MRIFFLVASLTVIIFASLLIAVPSGIVDNNEEDRSLPQSKVKRMSQRIGFKEESCVTNQGIPNEDSILTPEKPLEGEEVGDQRSFEMYWFDSSSYITITSELAALETNVAVWVQMEVYGTGMYNGRPQFSQSDAEAWAEDFQEIIYENETAHLGLPEDINGDGVIVYLMVVDSGSSYAGLYDSGAEGRNNVEQIWCDYFYGDLATVAHEFQHQIHRARDWDEEIWLNEGFSEYIPMWLGLFGSDNRTGSFLTYFEHNSDTPLIIWDYKSDYWNVRINYGVSFAFVSYLAEKYGGIDIVSEIIYLTENGIPSIDTALDDESTFFDQVFSNWIIANWADDTSIANGIYGYDWLDIDMDPTQVLTSLPTTINSDVYIRAADYYSLNSGSVPGTQGIKVTFNGTDDAHFFPVIISRGLKTSVKCIPLNVTQDGEGYFLLPEDWNDVTIAIANLDETVGGYADESFVDLEKKDFKFSMEPVNVSFSLNKSRIHFNLVDQKISISELIINCSFPDDPYYVTGDTQANVEYEILTFSGESTGLLGELEWNDNLQSWEVFGIDNSLLNLTSFKVNISVNGVFTGEIFYEFTYHTASLVVKPEIVMNSSQITSITVVDEDFNFDPQEIDQVNISVNSTADPEGIIVTLIETGQNTGVFIGNLTISLWISADTLRIMKVNANDVLIITFTDPNSAGGTVETISTEVIVQYKFQTAVIVTNPKEFISLNETVTITVIDNDLNLNHTLIDTLNVTISSDADSEGIVIILTETGNNTGIFKGNLSISFTSSNAELQIIRVNEQDSISIIFIDPNPEGSDGNRIVGEISVIASTTSRSTSTSDSDSVSTSTKSLSSDYVSGYEVFSILGTGIIILIIKKKKEKTN